MALNPQQLFDSISQQVGDRPVCVAYSGGVDSHVLLHLLSQPAFSGLSALRAIHINHGLQAEAANWAMHCERVASEQGVAFQMVTTEVSIDSGLGMEAAAREARYQALSAALAADEVLLTAQHQQDQAETLLLQLLRGAGPSGLSAMRERSELFSMTVLRPLLHISKQDILDYAQQHQLQWIDDPSNADTQINRNYIRQQLWPKLSQRWPAAARTLSRSADHCNDAVDILNDMAALDASACKTATGGLSIAVLMRLSAARRRNLLRYEIESRQLPLPSTRVLQAIIDELCLAKADALPVVRWANAEAKRYQDTLLLQTQSGQDVFEQKDYLVNDTNEITLADGRSLKWQQQTGQGLKAAALSAGLTLRFRRGGERIQLSGQQQHKSLKKLFQTWQIPPWQRASVPLLFAGEELIAVIGYAYAEGYAADSNDEGWLPYIQQ